MSTSAQQAIKGGASVYKPDGETLRQFLLNSTARLLCIQGPEGSGKSTASAMKLWMSAIRQAPQKDGIRRTRMLVVRNTFNDLKLTTVQTWKRLFPPEIYGQFLETAPFCHKIRAGDVECDVWFVALDDEGALHKVLSLEFTSIWVNEARELPRRVIGGLWRRRGRFPAVMDGGPSYPIMILDTNAPADDHWIPIMRGDVPIPSKLSDDEKRELVRPEGWEFWNQPGGLVEITDDAGNHVRFEPNPVAENTAWLPGGKNFYLEAARGQTIHDVRIALCNKLGRSRTGKPVFPMFRPDLHIAKQPLQPVEGHPILVGVDFGLTPAAVFGQHVMGRWLILHELVAEDDAGMGAVTFAPLLKAELASRFPGFKFSLFGDPAGDQRAQSDERSPFMIFRACGLPIQPAPTNDTTVRKEAVEAELNRLVNGYPAFLISPTCPRYAASMEWGYRYRKMKLAGADRYTDQPVKDEHSHVNDAGQYLLIGGGAGRALLTGTAGPKKPVNTKVSTSPLAANRAAALRRLR